MRLTFSKYSGSGNDFILVDNRQKFFPFHKKELIAHLCRRRTGIGADGIILLENSQKADFKMRIFNADGSEAEMCGNGIRCLMKFIRELGNTEEAYEIETMESKVRLSFKNDLVNVSMPKPYDLRWDLKIDIQNTCLRLHHINTGVPHVVLFVENLKSDKWMSLAPAIRHHAIFAPHGANVNFTCIASDGQVAVRTYERGVEGETLACGTGATAAALMAAKLLDLSSPVKVQPLSNEPIEISFKFECGQPADVFMAGPAVFIFHGKIDIE